MPITIADQIEVTRVKFFWGANDESRKIHWIMWDLALFARNRVCLLSTLLYYTSGVGIFYIIKIAYGFK